ncbi:hypothetical protein [Nonomuraea candida]|uniref:hypothetical protein n=1 Tax=Nonomuraea candida TaxID=359159 RepID=UPI0012FA5AE0|nr:hypothetical protein [Nonomuraea candida]
MPTRSAAVLTSGTATAAKLLAAALAFAGAYAGLSAYGSTGTAAAPSAAPSAGISARPAAAVTPAARELPVTAPAGEHTAPARSGVITMSVVPEPGPGCARSYPARSLVVNPGPGRTVSYHWRLARWSPATRQWRAYLVDHGGFAAPERAVEWRPRITANPGWYRIELVVKGAATVRSDRFQVSC